MENEKKQEEVKEEVVEQKDTANKDSKPNKKEHKKNNKEVEKLINEKNELNDKLLRVTAEMQNMKRRHDEEIARIYKYDGEDFIKKILSIVDNFERAINMDDDNLEDEVSKFLSGFKLIYCDLIKNLESTGVKVIECMDKPFNPEMMEAVMTEHIEGRDAGIVTDVMQKGYMYNDKVIRPAMVKVSE